MKYSLALAAAMAASASAFDVPSLTPANYDELTGGKTVFLKFFAPWCGHCKSMASDWEKLAEEWSGNNIGFVGEVDCTDEAAKPLCDENGVQGFPMLKYGDPAALDDYQGGRSYNDLSSFAKENLKPTCGLNNIDLCDDKKKAKIESLLAMSKDDLQKAISTESQKINDAKETFKTEIQKLQEKYEELMKVKTEVQKLQEKYEELLKTKEATEAEVKAGGLGLMKAVYL
uniref:Thioredoxin domain-containing protein n=2 Tax=Ditylum brightwellii TaxID=49249 RepID=A0A6V2LKI7_9STRA